MGTSVYALRVLWFCDVGITPLTRAWPADVALHPRSGERASEIDIARILNGAEVSVCFSFRYLIFIFVLTCHHKVRKAPSNDSCGCGRCYAASDTACAWRHVVRLISNVSKNSNTRSLYPDTVPLNPILWLNHQLWCVFCRTPFFLYYTWHCISVLTVTMLSYQLIKLLTYSLPNLLFNSPCTMLCIYRFGALSILNRQRDCWPSLVSTVLAQQGKVTNTSLFIILLYQYRAVTEFVVFGYNAVEWEVL